VDDLPAELSAFAALLNAQPSPVREMFQYCLCLMMVEVGKMRLVRTLPSEDATLCIFKTIAGESFTIPHPAISNEQEAAIIEMLREIILDEGF